MIIKNLSRRANLKNQLFRYIFRYIYRNEEIKEYDEHSFESTLQTLGVHFTGTDLHYLEQELKEAELQADFTKNSPDRNYINYIQNFILKDESLKKDKENNSESKEPFILKHNVFSNSINGFIREFQRNEAERIYKRSDQAVTHTVISWAEKDRDHITQEMLRETFSTYVSVRGENNIYVGTAHNLESSGHIHLHLIMGSTDKYGKSSRISKLEFQAVREKMELFQALKYPQLKHSVVELGKVKRERQQEGYKSLKRNERATFKNQLEQIVTKHSNDLDKLFHELEVKGYSPYFRNGKINGWQSENGLKFRCSRLSLDVEQIRGWFEEKETQKQELANIASIRSSSHELEKDEELELEDRFSTGNEDVDEDDSEKDTDDSGDESNIEDQENDDVHSLINDPEEDEDFENDDEFS